MSPLPKKAAQAAGVVTKPRQRRKAAAALAKAVSTKSKPKAQRSRKAPRRKVVVTAGPTREYVDPVRYLSNESSGKQGFAIAAACAARGDEVVLIAGPVHQETPKGVRRIDVMSAREMLAEVRLHFGRADALYMAAAVADWRPKRRLSGKWRKKDDGTDTASIDLVKNPDVLATVAKSKGERMVVGFALETGDGERRALAKLRRKNADYIVLNDDSALGSDRNTVTILGADGSSKKLTNKSKAAVAKVLAALDRH
ncbi:phosphopantothenoylcysteine decarboxylase [Engelhardtia mirabilis]|uniref:Coenzyme A biosynthesis bifunctional protein CoaBC n=1 Tax=Engelhardtia mirabilis TaxID=2528011 RepID=A0A518BRU5_9BACT|nr:Coenzyme A biosynthesis bifunctional protein CoaBC [Planctomycetes bacterium Pla133]QDV04019.1 Coenzyme A biosynthesis bifunctional protein CoaBC [Planctomycetes bacterium Pla86]